MNSLEMFYLNQYFKNLGYETHGFNYPSIRKPPAENAKKLHDFISSLDAEEVHIIAHSLGGVVTLHMFDQFTVKQNGKVVLLGCPYKGSVVARYFDTMPLFQRIALGKAQEGALVKHAPVWQGERPLGVIAGNQPYGMGVSLRAIDGMAHDGSVHVKETVIENATDFTVMPVSHTSMLFDKTVAEAIEQFLQTSEFPA
jgi:pimeloyl-ACP methyl ester carboxylesterase